MGIYIIEPRHDKTNKVSVRPAKTQISLGIRLLWSESSLCAQLVAKDPRFLHADSEDWSDWADTRLIWVFARRTLTLFMSCRGSYISLACILFYVCSTVRGNLELVFCTVKGDENWSSVAQMNSSMIKFQMIRKTMPVIKV